MKMKKMKMKNVGEENEKKMCIFPIIIHLL